ncbi:MAG: aminoglycoside phosphotransferase family protein [Candidatus Poribacteria bacterium]|nr:aminoglycoside phosphotransferase family protein [Candidatus Poribacteria bacterium]
MSLPPPTIFHSPWNDPAWDAEAFRWIDTELSRLKRTRVGELETLTRWGLSCVFRVPTDRGNVYFKESAKLPLFLCEPRAIRFIAEIDPSAVPAILAADEERYRMLMSDEGKPLGFDAPPERQSAALQAFAELQRKTITRVDWLLEQGSFDRRLSVLPGLLRMLADDGDSLALMQDDALAEEYRAKVDAIIEQVERLDDFGIPSTLAHGDLHADNISLNGDRFVFFDWSDTCVAHPFIDTLLVFWVKDEAARQMMKDAYLAPWSADFDPARLSEAWDVARVVCSAHQVTSYHHILRNLPPEEFNGMDRNLTQFVRSAVEGV